MIGSTFEHFFPLLKPANPGAARKRKVAKPGRKGRGPQSAEAL